jgi:Transglutaminase-like superfamily
MLVEQRTAEVKASQYWLPAHLCVCTTPAGTVLLDLERSRYLGLGAIETAALARLACNWRAGPAARAELSAARLAELTQLLLAAGLLCREAPSDELIHTPIELGGALSCADHEPSGLVAVRPAHVIHFLRAWLWARYALRSRSLYAIAREISECKIRAATPFDAARAVELVGIFRHLRPYAFTARAQCLFHALMLTNFLLRERVFPTWVIGVSTRPWAAHSWVQGGNLILDSTPEHILEYTPILSV